MLNQATYNVNYKFKQCAACALLLGGLGPSAPMSCREPVSARGSPLFTGIMVHQVLSIVHAQHLHSHRLLGMVVRKLPVTPQFVALSEVGHRQSGLGFRV